MSKLAHEQRWGGGRGQKKYKSRQWSIPGKCFSISLNNCNINTNKIDIPEKIDCEKQLGKNMPDLANDYHEHEPIRNKHYHQDEPNFEDQLYHNEPIQENHSYQESPEPETERMCFYHAKKQYHCIPRKGELMINGGFENQQDTFLGWVINSGVDEIDPSMGDIPHQGLNAARLGFQNPHAIIYQNVPGICPGSFYQLNFYISGAMECGSVPINIRMEFLDQFKNPLNNPALDILIPEDSLGEIGYTCFCNTTQSPAPPNTHFARVRFEIAKQSSKDKHVHLDDVSLVHL